MSSRDIPCALEGEHTSAAHGPGVFASDHGPICASCYHTRQERGLEGPDTEATFSGVPTYMLTTLLYSSNREGRGFGPARGQYMRVKRSKPAPRAREPYVKMRSSDLTRLLPRLTEEQRAPLALQLEEGLSYTEIAERLGLPLVTVRERLRRARESLRRLQTA